MWKYILAKGVHEFSEAIRVYRAIYLPYVDVLVEDVDSSILEVLYRFSREENGG